MMTLQNKICASDSLLRVLGARIIACLQKSEENEWQMKLTTDKANLHRYSSLRESIEQRIRIIAVVKNA